MKISALLLSIITALALVASPSVQAKSPKVTKLTFPKGSYCTSFEGEYKNRIFTIYLMPNQTLTIEGDDVVDDIIVKNPKGRTMRSKLDSYEWKITMKGTHTIRLIPSSINGGYDELKFCAFNNLPDD